MQSPMRGHINPRTLSPVLTLGPPTMAAVRPVRKMLITAVRRHGMVTIQAIPIGLRIQLCLP